MTALACSKDTSSPKPKTNKAAAQDQQGAGARGPMCEGGSFEQQLQRRAPSAQTGSAKPTTAPAPGPSTQADKEVRRLLRLASRMKTYSHWVAKAPGRAQNAIDRCSPETLQASYDSVRKTVGQWQDAQGELEALADSSATTLPATDPAFGKHRQKLETLVGPSKALERSADLDKELYRLCLTLTLQDHGGVAIRGFTAPPLGEARAQVGASYERALKTLWDAKAIRAKIGRAGKARFGQDAFTRELDGIQEVLDRNKGKGAVFLHAVIEASALDGRGKDALRGGVSGARQEANAEDDGIDGAAMAAIQGAADQIIALLDQKLLGDRERARMDAIVRGFEGAERQHLFMLLSDAGYYNLMFSRGRVENLDALRSDAGHFAESGDDVNIQRAKAGPDGELVPQEAGESMRQTSLAHGDKGGADGTLAAAGQIAEDIGYNFFPATLQVVAGLMNGLGDLPIIGPLYAAGGASLGQLAGELDKELGNHARFGQDVTKWRSAVADATGGLIADIMVLKLPDSLDIDSTGRNAIDRFNDIQDAMLGWKVGAGIYKDVQGDLAAWTADHEDPKADRKLLGDAFEHAGHRGADGLLEFALKRSPGGAMAQELKAGVAERKKKDETRALKELGYERANHRMGATLQQLSRTESRQGADALTARLRSEEAEVRRIALEARAQVDADFKALEAETKELISKLLSVKDPMVAMLHAAHLGLKAAISTVARIIRQEPREIVPADFVRGMGKFGYAAITQAAMNGVMKLLDALGEAGQGAALGEFFGKVALATAELSWGDQLQKVVKDQIQPVFDAMADAVNGAITHSGLDRLDMISTESDKEQRGKADATSRAAGKAAANALLPAPKAK